jgi:membrane fusion protein (multidrug efflux system)
MLALGIILGAVTGCGDSTVVGATPAQAQEKDNDEDEAEDAIAIEVGQVGRDTLSALYSTSATLRADKQATVTARTKGVIRQLLVEEGDWVEKDQKLAVLEDDEQRIAFEQASATYENKRREHERARSLHAQDLLSDEAHDAVQREAVEARHAAELAELTLSRTVIRATFAGRILVRHVDVGATVSDGTAVYDVADLAPLYADVQIPERQVARLQPGQMVRLLTNEDETSLDAVIERIAPAVDPTTGTIKITLAIRSAGSLRPGSFVRVGIVIDTHENTLVVPRSALVAEGRRWHLFRLANDEATQVELVEVTRGFEEGDQVEILGAVDAARPLEVGDRVVVTGASSLSDESKVQVMNEAAGEAETAEDEEGNSDEAQGVAA